MCRRDEQLTVRRRHELRHVEAIRQQRAHPAELGAQLGISVVSGAVHAQRVLPAIARRYAKHGVLAVFQQFESAGFESPLRERDARELRDAVALRFRCQLVEPGHPRL
jgi:hypothetical protein